MNYRLIVFIVGTINFVCAQDLYIADNSYLYARDVVLFVNNDIQLDTPTSNLFLRGDAQLIQNNNIKNSDEGELSIYRNQTSGIYEYNYFCSPVGVADTSNNSNLAFVGSNIHDPQDHTDLTNVNSNSYAYTLAYNGTTTELSNYWMHTFRDGEGYWSWNQIFDTGTAEPGYGFSLKGSPNTANVLDFRGRPNNGTILVSCAFDGTDNQPGSGTPNTAETLTGNPYPSTLDLKLFFVNSATNQSRLSGEIFFWEQAVTNSHYLAAYEGGYGVYAPGVLGDLSDNGTYSPAPFQFYNGQGGGIGGSSNIGSDYSTNNKRRYAAVGQGFMIQSDFITQGGIITFENSMRLVYIPEDSTTGGDGAIFAKNAKGKEKTTKKEVVAMSHNKIDYKAIIKNPSIVPEIRIHTHINNTFYKENVIAFRESTPDNNTFNKFYDGASINELNDDAYIISSDKALSIKSINYDESTRLALGLKASKDNTSFSIKINKLKDVPEEVNTYVFDKVNNTYTDVKNGAFEITLEQGIHNDRFEITFTAESVLNTDDTIFETLKVFQNNRISELKIVNPNKISIQSFHLYDVTGKRVISQAINASKRNLSFSTKSFSDGIYIAEVQTDNNTTIKRKVLISNRN